MDKYAVMSIQHSIIRSEMVDVELGCNGRLADVVRVPVKYDNLRPGSAFFVHRKRSGQPIAFCFSGGFYMPNPPKTLAEAWRQFNRIPGLMDKIYFYMALRNALHRYGKHAGINIPRDMMYLARLQSR